MTGHVWDIVGTDVGRMQGVRSKSLTKVDVLATFEQQMADYMQSVGRRIREARERLRPEVSQEAAAHAVGVSVKQYGRWERGESQPLKDEKWQRLADVLGLDVTELRSAPPKVLDPEGEVRSQLDRIEAMLQQVLDAISRPDAGQGSEQSELLPTLPSQRPRAQGNPAPRKRRAS